MKKAHLHFPQRPVNYAPRISSRRIGLRDFMNVAYREDGDGAPEGDEGEPSEETKALLAGIQKSVKDEFEKRGFQNADQVGTAISAAFRGMSLEFLRKLNFDPTKLKDDVAILGGEINKLQKRTLNAGNHAGLSAIKALFEDEATMKVVARAFDKKLGQPVVLTARAAVPVMTTGNVVNDGDIPEDILNSFKVDAFIKKRRPNEFIFDIADRTTVDEITEYKTWLEEGTEDGAFAIVAQGQVKPLVSKTLIRNVSQYQKVAGKRVYTEEFAKFRKEAYRIIEQLFNDQLVRNYAAILVTKLNTVAAGYIGTALDAQYVAPTDLHAVGAVAAQIQSLDFLPDVLIINPQDMWRIGLATTTIGSFLVQIPQINAGGALTLMGFNLVSTNRCPVGTFYLGEGGLYKIEDEPVQLRLGYGINVTTGTATVGGVAGQQVVTNVDSDVDTNRFRIIAETYFHAYIGTNHIGSFVKATFAAVKAALLKP